MTDTVAESPVRDEAPRSPGAILAAERERQGLGRADIAQRLHMSVSQVEALEMADYARLPRGPFLRGFARNYARTLAIDPEPLIALLAEDAPPERAPRIVVPTQNIRFDPLGARLDNPYVKAAGVAAAVIVLGFAAMYWWLFVRPQAAPAARNPQIEMSRTVAPAPPSAEPAKADEAPAESAASATTEPTTQQPAVLQPAASAPATTEAARTAAPGEGTIRLAFRGAAWVEITDARGRMLLSRTHPGGSSAEVIGRPPFNLVIGNAPEVRLTYNGNEVDLAPHTRVAVARFTLP